MADDAGAIAEHRALLGRIEELLGPVDEAAGRLVRTFETGGRVFTFGNGGSAADAQHAAAELVGRYTRARRPLPATSLAADPSALTCIANDFSFDDVFARQVHALVRAEDTVIGFTTSGRSANVVRGLAAARELGAATVLFGGGDGPPASEHADIAIVVPSTSTARVQELHLLLLHLVMDRVEAWAAAGEQA